VRDEFTSAQRTWLETNNERISGRLVGPNFRNRFDSSVSDPKLEEFLRERELLWQNCTMQCFLDDACIMKVTDMVFFEYETSHPNLLGIEQESLRRYLEGSGVWDKLREDLDALQDLCDRELEARRSGTESQL
jgi:hypothetical protein